MAKITTTDAMPTTMEELQKLLAEKDKEIATQQKKLEKQEKELKAARDVKPVAARAEDTSDKKRRVRVRLELSSANKEPLVVRVNDYICTIKRGVWVEVPYYVALSIRENEDADAKTMQVLDSLTRSYDESSKQYNV